MTIESYPSPLSLEGDEFLGPSKLLLTVMNELLLVIWTFKCICLSTLGFGLDCLFPTSEI